jgi:hypothetical protein
LDLSEVTERPRAKSGNVKRVFWTKAEELILFKLRSLHEGQFFSRFLFGNFLFRLSVFY